MNLTQNPIIALDINFADLHFTPLVLDLQKGGTFNSTHLPLH